jgi:hypothetical protein
MKKIILYVLICCGLLSACKKDFLDQRPNKALLVPASPADFRALLDNNFVFNNTPGLNFIADGDFYTTDAGFNGYNQDMERNSYTWAKDIYAGQPTADWNRPYQQVFYANVVLEGLAKLPDDGSAESRAIKGTALFHRAFAFYNLAAQYAAPYDAATAASLPGVPIRLTSDVSARVPRGTLQQAYDRIFADLAAARPLLPSVSAYKSRPTVTALQALLSRVCLSMGDYTRAGLYADSVLAADPALIDYNILNPAASRPFPRALPNGTDEVIFYAAQAAYSFNNSAAATFVDSNLYRSYGDGDLRKTLFFRQLTPGNFKFKGNYAGTLLYFSGLATDEMYLNSAECRARAGDGAGALERLNALLLTRWNSGTFVPYSAGSADAALALVLAERQKELVGRALRWSDLRRLNTDPRFRRTLVRQIGGATFTLEPDSKRYVFPIPEEEVRQGGLAQNER